MVNLSSVLSTRADISLAIIDLTTPAMRAIARPVKASRASSVTCRTADQGDVRDGPRTPVLPFLFGSKPLTRWASAWGAAIVIAPRATLWVSAELTP